ncbi:hypothetical protein Tco_0435625 [Tanacetum coccineum]
MASPRGAKQIDRRVIDDLIEFSRETSLNALIAEMEALEDQGELFDTLMDLKDDREGANTKLQGLNALIAQAEQEIKTKEAQQLLFISVGDWMCGFIDMFWVCGQEFVILDVSFSFELPGSFNDRALFIVQIMGLEPGRTLVKCPSVIVVRCEQNGTSISSLNDMAIFIVQIMRAKPVFADCSALSVEINEFVFCVVVQSVAISLAAMMDIEVLNGTTVSKFFDPGNSGAACSTEGSCFLVIIYVSPSTLGIKVTLSQHRRLIAELKALGQRGDALRALEALREIVARNVVKLGVLEQLVACTRVGIPLKAGYVSDMEDKE